MPINGQAIRYDGSNTIAVCRHGIQSPAACRGQLEEPALNTPTIGIATAPKHVSYPDVLRVWREADDIPEIGHAWVFDHLLPNSGDPLGPVLEGWTLLSALAAQTRRLRVGVLVTSNRFRPPAVLAKIAATVDAVADGRLDFGIGAGSRPGHPIARREYEAHGLPFADHRDAVEALEEACAVIRRLWTEPAPFDVHGTHVQLTGAFGNPKPVQRPHPPILIGGRTTALLRVVARHADIWNIPGGDLEDALARSAALDRLCADIGRDPGEIVRSMHISADLEHPELTRAAMREALDAGFTHLILGLGAPYPHGIATRVADELITPVRDGRR
jgi:alkanesulfonate monooxygenase SsuD/methylene tetrahydromethanopterin reductase-like flavin-dependent oxidoreductase (luciferase family)